MTRRHGMLRAVLGGMAAFALALGGVTAAAAEELPADATGSISGIVTREDDGSTLEGVTVSALDANREVVGEAQTDAAGVYDLGGLPDGSYRLHFGSPDPELLSEYWKNQYSWDFATQITITGGQATTGVDAALATAAFISGTVTRGADGAPLSSWVSVYDVNDTFDIETGNTMSDGTYRIGVPAGTYKVVFRSFGLAEEYWKDAGYWDTATEITVAAGDEVVGIDAALERPGAISGTVTVDAAGAAKVLVTAWIDGVEVRNIAAKPDTGAYSLALQKGTYILRATAMSADGTTIASQYYNGVATAEAATPISLTPDQTVTGIDFTLVDAPEPQPEPTITLSAGTIRAGDAVTVSGNGFEPNATIAFELRSDPIALGSLTADADGVLTGSLRIPVGAPVGAHTLVALSGAAVVASAAVDVTAAVVPGGPGTGGQGSEGQGAGGQSTGGATAPRGALAATGAEVPVALVAMGILLATLGAAMARRRRVES